MHPKDVRIVRIRTADMWFEESLALMHKSFVEDELRNDDDLRILTDSNHIFSYNAVVNDGNAAIEKLTELSRLPIVLEVEPPESSAEAARRVKFYEELGFVGWQTPYIQPAYSKDKSPVPLMLMSKGLAETLECAGIVTALLHRHVYGMKGLPR